MTPLHPHSNPIYDVDGIFTPLYRCGSWGTELSSVPPSISPCSLPYFSPQHWLPWPHYAFPLFVCLYHPPTNFPQAGIPVCFVYWNWEYSGNVCWMNEPAQVSTNGWQAVWVQSITWYLTIFSSSLLLSTNVGSQEDGGVGGSWAHPVPQTYQENSYIYSTNSENDLKTGRTDLPQFVIKRRPYWKGQEGQSHGHQTPGETPTNRGTPQARRSKTERSDPTPGTPGTGV